MEDVFEISVREYIKQIETERGKLERELMRIEGRLSGLKNALDMYSRQQIPVSGEYQAEKSRL
jgi:predicted nuclease with TOPRIM domain